MRKSCEWKGQLISTQSLLYFMNAYWQNLKTSALRDAVLVNFNWMCWASKERQNEEFKGELENGRLPHVHRSVWSPTLDVILRDRTKKTQLQNINIWKPGRFLRASGLTSTTCSYIVHVSADVYVPAIAKCLQENLSTSDLLPVSTKQMSLKPMHMEAWAFAKKKPKLSDNYFCTLGKNE